MQKRRRPSKAAPRRVATRSLETHQRIVDAALVAFAGLGFDGATTRDIAERAGVNQGLIAYHFASKEDLWKAAVDEIFAELRNTFGPHAEALADADPVTRARLIVRHFVRFAAAHPELHRLMMQEGKSDGPRMEWLVDRHVRPLYDLASQIMREAGLRPGGHRIAPLHLYYILIGAAAHLFVMAPECRRLTGIDPTEPAIVKAHADAIVDVIFDALVPAAPAVRRKKGSTR